MYDWRWRWRRRYSYYSYRYWHSRPRFDTIYSDLLLKMNMFKSFLDAIPKSRSQLVNDLEIPEGILKPHVFNDFEEDLLVKRESLASGSLEDCDMKACGLSTDSSVSLSRAMTDSEIDYERYRRLKNRAADPFDELKIAMEAFPPEYLESLQSYPYTSLLPEEVPTTRQRLLYNEALERRMERFFDEECRVFSDDDPALLDLEDALQSIDLKALEADLDSI